MTARRLGLFGGTFNPVHEGHLQIARDAKRAAELDEVMFIPCATPPHKTPTWLASGEDRLNMLTLALENEPAFTVNDLELDRRFYRRGVRRGGSSGQSTPRHTAVPDRATAYSHPNRATAARS